MKAQEYANEILYMVKEKPYKAKLGKINAMWQQFYCYKKLVMIIDAEMEQLCTCHKCI